MRACIKHPSRDNGVQSDLLSNMASVRSWGCLRQKHGLTSFMQFLIQSLMKDRIWLPHVWTFPWLAAPADEFVSAESASIWETRRR